MNIIGLIKTLYKTSYSIGKVASTLNDMNTLASGDPEKIAKRATRKAINKTAGSIIKKI